jgi:hypothetical protein
MLYTAPASHLFGLLDFSWPALLWEPSHEAGSGGFQAQGLAAVLQYAAAHGCSLKLVTQRWFPGAYAAPPREPGTVMRHIQWAQGHLSRKATAACPQVKPSTRKQGGVQWIVRMIQLRLAMTISNHAHSQYIRNRTSGVAYIRMLCLIVGRPCKQTDFDKKTKNRPHILAHLVA